MVCKWKLALKEFLKEYENDDNVIGAILCGDYSLGIENDYSNITVYLILSSNTSYKKKGVKESNSYFIEYFMSNKNDILNTLEKEYENGYMPLANMIGYGKIIYDLDDICKDLQRISLEYLDKQLPNITSFNLDVNNFNIWKKQNELKQMTLSNDLGYNILYYDLLFYIYNCYSEYLGIPKLQSNKIYKIITNNNFRNVNHIYKLPENNFLKLFINCFEINKQNIMYDNISKLIKYYYDKQGGFNVRTCQLEKEV